MKQTLLCVLLATTCLITTAKADLVRFNNGAGGNAGSFVDLGGLGFGAAPRLLTLQTNGVQSGAVTPSAGGPVVSGDAISGANKANTPTLGALGWLGGSGVAIGYNSNQTGNSGITLNSMTLSIYNPVTFSLVDSFSLASPVNYTVADLALQQGNGNGIFGFILDAAQRVEFNALNVTATMLVGLAANMGCAGTESATCQPSNDGADSFLALAVGGPVNPNCPDCVITPVSSVPIPGAVWLFGSGLAGLIAMNRKRRNRKAMPLAF